MKVQVIFSLLFITLIQPVFWGEENQFIISEDGSHIAYSEYGSGSPKIIFVHGWLGDQSNWDSQIEYFSKITRVITIDLPGFGLSSKDRYFKS